MGRGRLGERAELAQLPITAKPLDANAPSVKLWQAIDKVDKRVERRTGTPLLKPTRRKVLHLYLTTEATMLQLTPLAGVGSDSSVSYQLLNSLQIVLPHLPKGLKQEYQTPEQALRTRSSMMHQLENYKTNIINGALERWRRYREEDKPQGKAAFSEQGLANISAHSGRRRRTPAAQ